MVKLLVAQNLRDIQYINDHYKEYKFDAIVSNDHNSLRKVEGLRVNQIWISIEVLLKGMDRELFESLNNSLIYASVNPTNGFRIVI